MPSIRFEQALEELFTDLHHAKLFPDGKVISDATFDIPPVDLLAIYRKAKLTPGFDLLEFFKTYFNKQIDPASTYTSDPSQSVAHHIEKLWPILTRKPEPISNYSTKIPLPYPYVVPGGRFNEIYYWDSYFTMLGLEVSDKIDLIESMVKNFSYLIEQYGFIPNGNRTYFLGRSQPPFYSLMIQLLSEKIGKKILSEYNFALNKEYQFWMHGHDQTDLASAKAHKRVVQVKEGRFLNRYFDEDKWPRTEMYLDDVELLEKRGPEGAQLLLDIRAACESGWDFSSRWCAEPYKLETIHTTDILPIDLNCLLYHLETTLADSFESLGNQTVANQYADLASKRKTLILSYFWNPETEYFHDFDFKKETCTPSIHAAGLFPLFFNLATTQQAAGCAKIVQDQLLQAGGIATTTLVSGQQWDAPNGWAPLQWISYQGLKNYGHHELADTLKSRWVSLNTKVFKETGKLMEKYNVVDPNQKGGGGEYENQDGFGWTNGVLLKLLSEA